MASIRPEINELCLEFESALRSGNAPNIEDFLRSTNAKGADETALLSRLVLIELRYRWTRGEQPSAEEYTRRFPAHAGAIRELALRFARQIELEAANAALPTIAAPAFGMLRGRYELVSKLGAGSFGTVWRAWDSKLRRPVAVKVIDRTRSKDSEFDGALHEATAAAQLRHPNLVAVHDIGELDDTTFLVSDFIDGFDLKTVLSGGALRVPECAQITRKLADALHHAHSQGVIHRDVKPSNILMDTSGEPHIADFGIARWEHAERTLTQHHQVVGSPAYMSPEQARGRGVGARSDVYSLGMVLYQMLTGHLPFKGDPREVLFNVQFRDPPKPRSLDAKIPRDLETICLKAIAKRPEDRYQTAADFAADLGRHLEGLPIHARRISPLGRVWRWTLRQPIAAACYAMAAVAVIASGTFAAFMATPEEDGKWEVEITTEPEGADVVITPLDPSTDEPIIDPSLIQWPPELSPTSWRLVPGRYKVVASLGTDRFAEVIRTVPELNETISFPRNYHFWELIATRRIQWATIRIPPKSVTAGMILIPPSKDIEFGEIGSIEIPLNRGRVNAFYVAPTEFTAGDFIAMRGHAHKQSLPDVRPDQPMFARFDEAMQWTEDSGGRLLTEREFEYLARLIDAHHHGRFNELASLANVSGRQLDALNERLERVQKVLDGQAEWVWGAPSAYAIAAGIPTQTFGAGEFRILRGIPPEDSHAWDETGFPLGNIHSRQVQLYVTGSPGHGFRVARSAMFDQRK